ncbi:hypothetical protein BGZ57DRAFT_417003 [Hyaloscypha finlandica]|nr:hypothetical protein BGZ57DRAFT_417003 [Hyaloscypha finlandica]
MFAFISSSRLLHHTPTLHCLLPSSIMDSISSTEYRHPDYDSPQHDQPPAYNYGNPPEYGHSSVFGISRQVDEWIAGKTPYCYLDSCEKLFHLTNTVKRHRSRLTLLPLTREVVDNAFSSHQWLRAGLVSLPAAIVHDIAEPSYHISRMAIALFQSKYEKMRAENEILDEILDSLLLSLEAVLRMVIRLGLETREAVEQQIQNQGFYLYLSLARVLEAYGSRFAPPGTVYLASEKRLPKGHCSSTARLHFDQIHKLKSNLLFVDLPPAYTLPDASTIVERWLRKVLPALKDSSVDMGEDDHFSHVLQRLRNIRDELSGLVLSRQIYKLLRSAKRLGEQIPASPRVSVVKNAFLATSPMWIGVPL